ncbi:MAG TPA: hypothetical protein VH189_05215, partial [Rhizomicrobium sp.]|nr:hypothetical protein [Rhizomicrobium sp.]
SNLDSRTLQALLELTQQDPNDPTQTGQAGQTGQTAGQPQGAHHHHHHGGGMMQAQSQPGDPSQSATASATTGLSPATDASGGDVDASLEQALLNV